MTYERTERIRRAAILLASLEEALAEQLLRELPAPEADKVLAELDRLEAIDPEEQADVLEEFRRATRRGGGDRGAVEFAYTTAPSAPVVPAAVTAADAPAAPDADTAAMAELLSGEQPQVIAAALSRLNGEQGAAVFAALPAELHLEVLDRVSRLTLADEESVLEVESQLLQKVGERRERRERAAAGAELARRLLAKTSPQRQAVLLERISAKRTSQAVAPPAPRPVQATAARASLAAPRWQTLLGTSRRPISAEATTAGTRKAELADSDSVLEDQSHALESMSDEVLVEALRRVDDETGLRALASASEKLVKRISRRLPRGQARKLRRLLRSFGPTRLADMRQAQHELLRVANECMQTSAAA
jgi:flagellar motor switch protein FliG